MSTESARSRLRARDDDVRLRAAPAPVFVLSLEPPVAAAARAGSAGGPKIIFVPPVWTALDAALARFQQSGVRGSASESERFRDDRASGPVRFERNFVDDAPARPAAGHNVSSAGRGGAVLIILGDGETSESTRLCRLASTARNLADIELPDALGQRPPGRWLEPGGPAIRQSVAPLRELGAGLRSLGFAVSIEGDCGEGLSNALFYAALRRGFTRAFHVGAPPADRAAVLAALTAELRHLQSRRRDPGERKSGEEG